MITPSVHGTLYIISLECHHSPVKWGFCSSSSGGVPEAWGGCYLPGRGAGSGEGWHWSPVSASRPAAFSQPQPRRPTVELRHNWAPKPCSRWFWPGAAQLALRSSPRHTQSQTFLHPSTPTSMYTLGWEKCLYFH